MNQRDEQREQTRQSIVEAAIETFAAKGFDGSGTRDIAARAGVTQGLISYHFDSKDDLWRAAADHLFRAVAASMPEQAAPPEADPEGARAAIRAYVRFGASHPELFHFVVDAGRSDGERMRWLVDTHVRPWFTAITRLAEIDDPSVALHLHYALVGASSLVFALAPECRTLTGVDPTDEAVVERHADFVAQLFIS